MSGFADAHSKGYHPLADYLRKNPDAINLPPEQLASRFELPVEDVRKILATVRNRSERRAIEAESEPRPRLKPVVQRMYSTAVVPSAQSVWRGWTFSTNKPAWFVAFTTVVAIIVGWVTLSAGLSEVRTGMHLNVYRTSQSVLLVVVLVLQLACYFRHGMIRHALYGALVNWVILSSAAIIAIWWRTFNGPKQDENMLPLLVVIVFAMLLLAGVYALIACVSAVLGGYYGMRAADRRRVRLSRQELLERLFEIEERLRQGPTASALSGGLLNHPNVAAVRRNPVAFAGALGAILGLLNTLSIAGLNTLQASGQKLDGAEIAMIVVLIIFVTGWLIAQASLAFLAGTFWKAVLANVVFAVSFWLSELLPLPGLGYQNAMNDMPIAGVAMLMITIGVASVGSLGAAVEDRAIQNLRLQMNDPGALLAEMLDIQHMLSPSRATICILVVDVARSSEMKAAADPLVVEYSFREYQAMVKDISELYGGTVHSTAGDGAVVGFPSATQALAAARKIQTDIAEFNKEVNRLKSPFRLRIGLHQGQVAGELEKVQFTEVIDIAAHVQEVAPVGDIALTSLVAESLENESLAQLKDPVDGHEVSVVLNPTVDG